MAENRNIKKITGSTGNAYVDMPARAAFITFCGTIATIGCAIANTDATLTGSIVTAASTGAIVAAALFDATLRKRL